MSVPDLTGNVLRPSRVVVRGMTSQGSVRVIEADALEARALLHELDHLDGLLFLDWVATPTPTCSNEAPTADLHHRCLPYTHPTTSFAAVLVSP